MNVYYTDDIRSIDADYCAQTGTSEEELIARAARAFTSAFLRDFVPSVEEALVIAGPGNNGADARGVAGLLRQRGWKVYLHDLTDGRTPEQHDKEWKTVLKTLDSRVPVIDGLLGSGLSRPITGTFRQMITDINTLPNPVYAVDIPSGLPGQENIPPDAVIVCAQKTYTFQFPKLNFFFEDNYKYVGEWEVLDIGMGNGDYSRIKTPFRTVDASFIDAIYTTKRNPFAHKNTFGHALLIAGSKGKMGAALLSAAACMRTGAGLLTAHIPARGEVPFHTSLPEAMLSLDYDRDCVTHLPGTIATGGVRYRAVGAGPGLGTGRATAAMLGELLDMYVSRADRPALVLDADALNIIASAPGYLSKIPVGTVLTPHPKEFDRLACAAGMPAAGSGYDRAMQAVEFSRRFGVVLLLKGHFSLICTPDGPHWFNTTGNPGMATAGSGDVLTGIILGLLTQGYPPEQAAIAGAYIHGQAGDRAAEKTHAFMISGDIIASMVPMEL
ncbi:MAG: NAD(P)H-hydrate dehydratase [Bacteroidales bacterium]|nr:NAD(P)H-hydrate dehydratase [Bacteroidales bacterium]